MTLLITLCFFALVLVLFVFYCAIDSLFTKNFNNVSRLLERIDITINSKYEVYPEKGYCTDCNTHLKKEECVPYKSIGSINYYCPKCWKNGINDSSDLEPFEITEFRTKI